MGFDQDHGAAEFAVFGGEHLGGLRDQCGFAEAGDPAEGCNDPGVEAAAAGGVVQVNGGVPAGDQVGPDRDGFAGVHLTADHAPARSLIHQLSVRRLRRARCGGAASVGPAPARMASW